MRQADDAEESARAGPALEGDVRLAALAGDSKFWLVTPLDRARRDLKEPGVLVPTGNRVAFIDRAADLLAPMDELHWQLLLAWAWMATDRPQSPRARAACGARRLPQVPKPPCAVFQCEATRASEGLTGKLHLGRDARQRPANPRALATSRRINAASTLFENVIESLDNERARVKS